MLSKKLLSALSLFPILAVSASNLASQKVLLSPEAHKNHGIPQALFDDFNDLAKIVDITNCLQTPEGISYPFQCNSFCREFPELKLLKQWNTADDLGDSYGYIAISHEKGKERIVIAFAGTYSLANAVTDLYATPEDYIPLYSGADSTVGNCPGCKVHGDAYREWLKTENLIGSTVSEFATQYITAEENTYRLILVGYGLGGAVATLAAVDFEARGWNPQITTFSQPKVGNGIFADYLTGKFTPSTYRRVTHVSDPVPQFPSNGQEFAHYEHEYFISKEFAPYTAADVQACNGNLDIICSAHMDISNTLNLDWGSSDYFHHTDTCIREPASLFSFSSSFFIIGFEGQGLQKRSNIDPKFYTVLETIREEPEGEDDHPPTEFERPRDKNGNRKRNVRTDSDARLVKPIPDSKFAKTFAMVEPAPKRAPPEFEDEDLYRAMGGHEKAQGMWIKPQKRPVTEMQRRSVAVDSDTKFVKAVPDSKFKKVFAMVEPPEPEPEEEVYVPEYEDEEIYNSMRGFKTAQSMWIKPKESSEKEKRDIHVEPENSLGGAIPSIKVKSKPASNEYGVKVDSLERLPVIADGRSLERFPIIIDEAPLGKISITADRKGAPLGRLPTITDGKDIPELENSPFENSHGLEVPPYEDAPGHKVSPSDNAPSLQYTLKHRYPTMSSFEFDDLKLDLEFEDLEIVDLEKRGLDRALKFFHAPKEVLNAQLAANDEAAAYEAYLKTQQKPNGKPGAAPSEYNPDEDYVKKGGSVLIMNGRPLEVDGRPVNRNPIQKRSNGHRRGPGLGLNHGSGGPKRGGLKRGGDKVTEMSSSSPPTTQSNSVVGVIENAVPSSFEEETVNVQKGRNFVLMNGRPMPANFAQKSTKPQKRSLTPEHVQRFRIPNERVFGPEQPLRTPEEHFSSPEHHSHTPENRFRKPSHFHTSKEHLSHAEQNFRKPEEHFRDPGQHFPAPEERFSITEKNFREPEKHVSRPEDHFAIPEQHFRQPEANFYPTEDKFTIPEQRFDASEDYFYAPKERFYPGSIFYTPEEKSCILQEQIYTPEGQHFTNEEQFELPQELLDFSAEEQFEVPEKYFFIPGERAYLPEENEHIPNQREMWEIQKSLTGPITHAWKDSRTNNEAYAGSLPSEADKKKFLHNYRYKRAN